MWVIRVYKVFLNALCALTATSAVQIPLCTTEVMKALQEAATAEPLHMANWSMVNCLADGPGKLTLLHEAAKVGAFGSIRRLVAQGADPLALDRRGAMPLHWAASHGFDKAVEALLESLGEEKRSAVLQAIDVEGLTPLDYAEVNSRIRAAVALVRNAAMRGDGLLMEGGCPGSAVDAVLLGKSGDLAEVIQRSASFFSSPIADCILNSDPREWSLLHLAIGTAVLSLNPMESSVEIVKELLIQGADATREDAYGQTPLFFAVKAGRMDLVELLLDSAPTEVNHLDSRDQTPLLCAAMTGREEVAKLLITKGANVEQVDCDGQSARDLALEKGHKTLLDDLIMVPTGVRGMSKKTSSRGAFKREVLSILFMIMFIIAVSRMVGKGVCPCSPWRCKGIHA